MILRTWNTFIFPLIFKSSSRQEETFSVLTFQAITLPSSTFFPLQKSKSGKKGSSFFMQKRGRGTPSFNFLNKKNTRKFQIKQVCAKPIHWCHSYFSNWVSWMQEVYKELWGHFFLTWMSATSYQFTSFFHSLKMNRYSQPKSKRRNKPAFVLRNIFINKTVNSTCLAFPIMNKLALQQIKKL